MPIEFPCTCGKRLKVADEHAGKRVRCPVCGVPQLVPDAEPVVDLEVVEDEHPGGVTLEPSAPDGASADLADNARKVTTGSKKKPKKRSSAGKEGPLARMYMDQARREARQDEARSRASRPGRDEPAGMTMFGVHLTAGVVGAFSMLIAGIAGMGFVAAFKDQMQISPRVFIGAIACTALGGLALVKLVFFGGEED